MPGHADAATLQSYFMGVESVRSDAEREWGAQRLILLVSDTTRAKYLRTLASWSKAYQTAWEAEYVTRDMLDAVTDRAAGMKRAFTAMIAEASTAGHRPVSPWVWEAPLSDGSVLAVCQTDDDAAKVIADGRYLRVVTATEVANIWEALPTVLQVAKVEFPGAKFQGSGRGWVKAGDEIPFGEQAA